MNKKIQKFIQNRIQHYNHMRYWKKREYVLNVGKKSKFKTLLYLKYLKKCEAFNCAFISTYSGGGAIFKEAPILPHGINGIVIGNNVKVGTGCTIMHRVTISEGTPEKPTIIGDNVFIGTGAVIRSGRTIGNNVKIGANAVVTHDIPSNCVVGGVPAVVLKKL